MRLSLRRDSQNGAKSPAMLLVWAIVVGFLFGLIGAGEYVEDRLRVVRNHINERPASGDIVLVAIDEKAVRDVGRWPWPRGRTAELVTAIEAGRPKMQVYDIMFPEKSDTQQDQLLADAIGKSRNVVLAFRPYAGAQQGHREDVYPLPQIRGKAAIGTIALRYNYANEAWLLPAGFKSNSGIIPAFSTILAGRQARSDEMFRVDYSVDPESIPVVSASDLLAGRVDRHILAGKTVIVGTAAERLGDQFMVPGWGKASGVYIHIIGAETLKAGRPLDIGWIPAFLLALVSIVGATRLSGRARPMALGGAALLLLILPILLERRLIFADVTAGLFVVTWVAAGLAIAAMKQRGLVNLVSGLPNLNALRLAGHERDRPLVAARIVNYPQIVSTLSIDKERLLVGQIVARLQVGSEIATVYQGDEGIFVWTVPPGTAIGHHVEALHALFRSPARIEGRALDIAISFGVEIGSGRSVANRLGSALVAADEAFAEGLRWKYHDPERQKDAEWRLSLLSQLDDAIDHGQVWVAYQPQVDLATGRIRGAEALARWTHPEKGPISPNEFISAAEQNDRIQKLTFFVLDHAIAAAAKANRDHGAFDMAVNLSARMLSDKSLPSRVQTLLDRHHLDPARLTLELTETATLASNGSDIDPLLRLRDLGIRISIDDYGTGLSTLEYLKKIPASEIKIDQSFIKSMRDNRSDLVMVQSTIALAHSLGRTVVAEGVETRETFDMLVAMKCDIAQGFLIGRPCSVNDLTKRLLGERKRHAA